MTTQHLPRAALLVLLALTASACSDSQSSSSANVTLEEEPTRGMLELQPYGTAASFRPASTAPTDSASINSPVLVVGGERLELRRIEQVDQ
jgi:hypothetical protein